MMLPRRAFLGAELPADDVAFGPTGMTIAGVSRGGMADRAGLVAGDRIVSLGELPVRDPCELDVALRAAGGRERVQIAYAHSTVKRGKSTTPALTMREVAVVPLPHEAGATYGELAVAGARLRTLVMRAAKATACVYVIQGIACESIDHAATPEAPLAGLVAGWVEAGFDVVRVDKRGVGDSEGERCDRVDFATERADTAAAYAFAAAHARERRVPLVVFGHSVGGVLAPVVAKAAAAIVVYGAPVQRWLACLSASVRRQLELRSAPREVIELELRKLDDLARLGELNGRSALYHVQLDAINVEAAWRAITSPVLVVRGELDWVVDADDQSRIGELALGGATIADVPNLDHLLGWHADRAASLRDYGIGRFDPSIVTCTAEWIRRTLRT